MPDSRGSDLSSIFTTKPSMDRRVPAIHIDVADLSEPDAITFSDLFNLIVGWLKTIR
jgi:hypothetical protein